MATRLKIFRVILSGIILVPAATSVAQKTPSQLALMKPVTIIGRSGQMDRDVSPGRITASYQLACGERFRGVVIRDLGSGFARSTVSKMSGHGPIMELAVAVDRKEAFCSSLPRTMTFEVPIKPTVRVRPIKLREPRRITLEEAFDIATSSEGISISWQTNCRPIAGVLLRPVLSGGDAKLEISLARSSRDDSAGSSQLNCPREIEQINLSAVDLPADSLHLGQRPGKLESSYFLRIASPNDVSTSKEGQLLVRWSQNCRERAVGVVFLGDRGEDVAVVTAVVPVAPCEGAKKSNVVTVVPGFRVSGDQRLRPASAEMVADLGSVFKYNYSVIPASKIEPNSRVSLGNITVINKAPLCGVSLGVIAAGDSYGNVSVGVLVGSPESVCMVSGPSNVDRLESPLTLAETALKPRIFGLRVFGNTFN